MAKNILTEIRRSQEILRTIKGTQYYGDHVYSLTLASDLERCTTVREYSVPYMLFTDHSQRPLGDGLGADFKVSTKDREITIFLPPLLREFVIVEEGDEKITKEVPDAFRFIWELFS